MSAFTDFDCAELSPSRAYFLLISVLVPRPIAWVTTRSPNGVVNAAPYSFYAGISGNPPIVGLGIGRRPDRRMKDTARNILQSGEFVIHLAEQDRLKDLVASSAEFEPEVGEPSALGLQLEPSVKVHVPALSCARVRLECRLHRHLEVGHGPTDFMMGEVLLFRLQSELVGDDGRVKEAELNPVGRLGGAGYAPVESRLEIERPAPPA